MLKELTERLNSRRLREFNEIELKIYMPFLKNFYTMKVTLCRLERIPKVGLLKLINFDLVKFSKFTSRRS
jgi:hypothetical protein